MYQTGMPVPCTCTDPTHMPGMPVPRTVSPREHTGHDGLPAGGALRGEGTAVAVVTEQLAVLAGEGLIG